MSDGFLMGILISVISGSGVAFGWMLGERYGCEKKIARELFRSTREEIKRSAQE